MDADKLFIEAQKYCWFNEIYVLVKPLPKRGIYKIIISRSGKEKVGHQEYEDKLSFKTIEEKKGDKVLKHKVAVPSVHTKIRELYLDIYQKSFNN